MRADFFFFIIFLDEKLFYFNFLGIDATLESVGY